MCLLDPVVHRSVSESRVLLQSLSLFIKMLILFVFKVNVVVQRKLDAEQKRTRGKFHTVCL